MLRYARELGYAPPAAQISELKSAFERDASPERRRQLLINYAITSISERDRAEVLGAFGVSQEEFNAAALAAAP